MQRLSLGVEMWTLLTDALNVGRRWRRSERHEEINGINYVFKWRVVFHVRQVRFLSIPTFFSFLFRVAIENLGAILHRHQVPINCLENFLLKRIVILQKFKSATETRVATGVVHFNDFKVWFIKCFAISIFIGSTRVIAETRVKRTQQGAKISRGFQIDWPN